MQYRSLCSTVQRLHDVKEEYYQYVELCKKIVAGMPQTVDDDHKKKTINQTESDDCFIVVNREPEYLREGALSYAKLHDMHDKLQQLYDLHEWADDNIPTIRASKFYGLPQPKRKTTTTKKRESAPTYSGKRPEACKDITMRWPLYKTQFWLSSKFGPRKKTDGSWGFHYGIDMAALKGTPVRAAQGGVVVETQYSDRGYGKCIVIAHNKKYKTRYAHLDAILVKVGQKVDSGHYIGRVGDTGSVRGKNASHLHFEVIVFGKQINPLYVLR